ncbi:MAG: hypothetical protein K2M08_01135 [Anaeroplasmataceae bacterium]|nr:hypothetical protein [Anaeroplasmataceae bacterium]
MMTIQIAHINIHIDLKYEKDFYNIESYQTDEKSDYFVASHLDSFPKIEGKKIRETEFYDLYEGDSSLIQIQKSNIEIIGYIVYRDERIDLYLKRNDFATEYLLSQYALLYILNRNQNSLFIHSSSIVYHNKGILFSAKSGTGKSTHARLWRTYTDALALNDDKNIIVLENDRLILYSNPWSGKHQIHQNIVAPLSCIVFLYQSKTNIVKKLKPNEAMRLLLGQIEPPRKDSIDAWNEVVDKILELPIYYYGCNMEEGAVTTLKERLEMDLCL